MLFIADSSQGQSETMQPFLLRYMYTLYTQNQGY